MRRTSLSAIALAAALAAWIGPTEAVEVTGEQVVPETQLNQEVAVRDVREHDGVVSGTVVNRSDRQLRDVRLLIRYLWLWNNEFRPGTSDPSRAEYFTLPQDVPPHGQVEFTYRPAAPLPERPDGHFETQVRVASMVEVSPPTSPTAGAGERRPAE
jgi:hypothetical protein